MIATVAINLIPIVLAGLAALYVGRGSRMELRVLAWVPVTPLARWGLIFTRDVARDPTAHNLWPLELVYWLLHSAVLFGAFFVAKLIFTRPPAALPVHEHRDRLKDGQPIAATRHQTQRATNAHQRALFVVALFVSAVVLTWCPSGR